MGGKTGYKQNEGEAWNKGDKFSEHTYTAFRAAIVEKSRLDKGFQSLFY